MQTKELESKHLRMAYECLYAIGNSFTLESMMAEVVLRFYEVTEAVYIAYYEDYKSATPLVGAGQRVPSEAVQKRKDSFLRESAIHFQIILPLRKGYLECIYTKREDIGRIYSILRGFIKKINFAQSACEGVKEIEELNAHLEENIDAAVNKIREHEQMLFVQSKSAIMGEMLEMIAHQWRQPITSIGMIANNMHMSIILSDETPSHKEEFEREIEQIHAQVNYLSHTIDDFRSFFKESKKRENIELGAFLYKSTSLMQKLLEKNGITLDIDTSCADIWLNVYKNELTQVLLNLLNNAKDAFEDLQLLTKKITIHCFMQDTSVVLEIQDNAGGIKEEIIEKIFEPYFSTKKAKNGTGIGLYMSKIILEKHFGATLSVSNKAGGAAFCITLPLVFKEL